VFLFLRQGSPPMIVHTVHFQHLGACVGPYFYLTPAGSYPPQPWQMMSGPMAIAQPFGSVPASQSYAQLGSMTNLIQNGRGKDQIDLSLCVHEQRITIFDYKEHEPAVNSKGRFTRVIIVKWYKFSSYLDRGNLCYTAKLI
jgi:hypothetical protein